MADSLHRDLLRSVSRSFYLSMRLLPMAMRGPVSLGYLLARASDTLADTAAVPVGDRRAALDEFRASLETGGRFPGQWAATFGPYQHHAGEAALLSRLGECQAWLATVSEPNRQAIVSVLAEITAGQAWDLERFGGANADRPAFCEGDGELDLYTYRVAGCVGEFWTRVGFLNLGERFASLPDQPQMLAEGRSLGQGLQLVNILRDLGEDLRAGRCYLPRPSLLEAGWERDRAAAIATVAAQWRERCRDRLRPGWDYVRRLRRGRVRAATSLPLILAEKTVDRLDAVGAGALTERVKVSRSQVWLALARALVA